jgi:hypothetical protein
LIQWGPGSGPGSRARPGLGGSRTPARLGRPGRWAPGGQPGSVAGGRLDSRAAANLKLDRATVTSHRPCQRLGAALLAGIRLDYCLLSESEHWHGIDSVGIWPGPRPGARAQRGLAPGRGGSESRAAPARLGWPGRWAPGGQPGSVADRSENFGLAGARSMKLDRAT